MLSGTFDLMKQAEQNTKPKTVKKTVKPVRKFFDDRTQYKFKLWGLQLAILHKRTLTWYFIPKTKWERCTNGYKAVHEIRGVMIALRLKNIKIQR